MNRRVIIPSSLMFLALLFISGQAFGDPSQDHEVHQEELAEFAKCITKQGWVMYSSFTCPACRAQQKLFGEASAYLRIVECNPHSPHTQVEQCLEKGIRHTPTWVMIQKGAEVKRFKGYKELDDLASITGCTQ